MRAANGRFRGRRHSITPKVVRGKCRAGCRPIYHDGFWQLFDPRSAEMIDTQTIHTPPPAAAAAR